MLVYADVSARRAFSKFFPGRVLELETEKAIRAGHIRLGSRGGQVIGPDWEALVERTKPRLRPTGRAWIVKSVRARRSNE